MAYKVVRFLGRGSPEALADQLGARWAGALSVPAGDGTAQGRPLRVALGVPLELPDLPAPPFAAVDVQWWPDVQGALASEEWLASVAPELRIGSGLVGDGVSRVVAEEVVVRGRDYLDARWEAGDERYTMMSFGKRDSRLTLEEFSARWRSEAGTLGGQDIPDEVRGLAYVQNHPVPLDGHEWPFDAVNEAWFESLDHLLQRRAWFAARQDTALRTSSEPFMDPAQVGSLLLHERPLP